MVAAARMRGIGAAPGSQSLRSGTTTWAPLLRATGGPLSPLAQCRFACGSSGGSPVVSSALPRPSSTAVHTSASRIDSTPREVAMMKWNVRRNTASKLVTLACLPSTLTLGFISLRCSASSCARLAPARSGGTEKRALILRSSALSTPASWMTRRPMPESTRFLHTSLDRPLAPSTRTCAPWRPRCVAAPQSRIERSCRFTSLMPSSPVPDMRTNFSRLLRTKSSRPFGVLGSFHWCGVNSHPLRRMSDGKKRR